MSMGRQIPWEEKTPTMVSPFVAFKGLPYMLQHLWHLNYHILKLLKHVFGLQFFRGAQTGNRMTLNEDGTFIWHPLTDFRITGWTGYTEVGQYVTLPDHCAHK